jgi:hypothetical protein
MAELTIVGYKRLFEVRVLHHYWLDDGIDTFDSLANADQIKRLLTYNASQFLSIEPTPATDHLLKGLNFKFKETTLGFLVGVPANVSIPSDMFLEFTLSIKRAEFFNYTALTLVKQKTTTLYYEAEKRNRRFRENAFLFSNETGTSKVVNSAKTLFLSRPIPAFSGATDYDVESFVAPLSQATWDIPHGGTASSPGWQDLTSPAQPRPIYVNQDDVPALVAPPGLLGVPAKGVELQDGTDENVFAWIRIKTLAIDSEFGLVKWQRAGDPSSGMVLAQPVFEIRFKNRSTLWNYYDKRTGKTGAPLHHVGPLPLTFYGNASSSTTTDQKPTVDYVSVITDPVDPTRAHILASEIFQVI